VLNVRFSPDGRTIATTGTDNTLILWDAGIGREIERIAGPTLFDFMPSATNRIVAVNEGIKTVSLLNLDTKERQFLALNEYIRSITFLGERILAVGIMNEARLYSVPALELQTTITGPRGPVPHVTSTPDGRTLAVPGWGGVVQLWNTRVQHGVGRLPLAMDSLTISQFSPDGNTLAVSSRGTGIYLFRAPSLPEIDRQIKDPGGGLSSR
jgi:WD40 repeat protein